MKKFKIVAIALCAVLMTGILAGCMYDSEETQYTNELKDQIQDSIGFPNITNFFEYSQLKKMSTQVNGFIRGLVLGMVFLMEQQLPPLNLRKRPVVEVVIGTLYLLQSRMDCIQKVL